MEHTISSKVVVPVNDCKERCTGGVTNLVTAQLNREYTIKEVNTNDEELKNFLFTLGCFAGETVTVLSILSDSFVISVKDAKYSIDRDIAEVITVQ